MSMIIMKALIFKSEYEIAKVVRVIRSVGKSKKGDKSE